MNPKKIQLMDAQDKLRISSNRIFEFIKIVKEIDLINRLYESKQPKNIQKFEDMFKCENNL